MQLRRTLRPNGRRVAVAVTAAVALTATGAMAAGALTPPPFHANHTVGLKQVGPIDETNGFPLWYKDTTGTRLEMCLNPSDPNCVIMGPLPNPAAPVAFPSNFPDEAFWSKADTTIDAGGGNNALLNTGVEASFTGGVPKAGDQITFGRTRVRVSGLVDGADYRVTEPYGKHTFTAEPGAFKGINSTSDVGSLTPDGVFDQTLGAPVAPFLKWDPAAAPAAPAGYLGDPAAPHPVTGSPYNTNLFRVEGPAGSFAGSTQLCSDPTLGDDPVATDDCIESNQFTVQGKLATRAGVQVTKAFYQNFDTGNMIDLYAVSEPNQTLSVTGTGVSQTTMHGDASGHYFARVYSDGPPPTNLTVTNSTDKPATVSHVAQSMFGDKVHLTSAVYNTDTSTLKVTAQSGADLATLKLAAFPTAVPAIDATGSRTWTIPALAVPPDTVTVTSNKGGVGSSDVVVTGADFPSNQVKAAIAADANAVQIGGTVTLDGLLSTGTVSSYAWSIMSGPAGGASLTPTATGEGAAFQPTVAGTYVVKLLVTGTTPTNTSTDTYTITVSGATAVPVANAGPDQLGVVPTSTVSLDGTASKFAQSYAWTQPVGQNVALAGADTANPTFVMPVTTAPKTYAFTLTITDADGTPVTDSVNVVSAPDVVGVDSASFKVSSADWRIRGSANYCSANNLLTFTLKRPDGSTANVGTATPALALGVCSYDFRVKSAPVGLRPPAGSTMTVKSALGGQVLDHVITFL
jgi:hypothetical protein